MRRLAFVFALFFAISAHAEEAERRLVLMVQYVATDYRGALSNAAEFAENVQTAREAAALYRRLSPGGAQAAALEALRAKVESKTAPEDVENAANVLVVRLRQELKVSPGPLFWPDLASGARAYAANCASCHGAEGRGDGPAAAALNPRPPDMTSRAWADRRAPFQLFNTMTLGIPGTAMAPFEQAVDHHTRWAIAFYLLTLQAPEKTREYRPWLGVIELASATNEELAKRLQETAGVDRETAHAMVDAARRAAPPELTIAAAMARMKGAVAAAGRLVADGRRDDASDLVAQTYYDAVEPVEPALMQVSAEDLPEMETRVTALRNAISQGKPVDSEVAAAAEELDRIALLAPDPKVESGPPKAETRSIAIVAVVVLAALAAWAVYRRR